MLLAGVGLAFLLRVIFNNGAKIEVAFLEIRSRARRRGNLFRCRQVLPLFVQNEGPLFDGANAIVRLLCGRKGSDVRASGMGRYLA